MSASTNGFGCTIEYMNAPPRPVHQILREIEVIALCIVQKLPRRGVPDIEIADRFKHVAIEERVGFIDDRPARKAKTASAE